MRMFDYYSNVEYKMKEGDFIVSKTDLKGIITYCNKTFIEMAKYDEKELLGQPHNIIRHKDMPRAVFKLLWDEIQEGREVFAFVKNRSKDGGFYWVYANVTASKDENGRIIGYYSVRRKPNEKALEVIQKVYEEMLRIEAQSGMEDSLDYLLNKVCKDHKMEYNQLIIHLQHNL